MIKGICSLLISCTCFFAASQNCDLPKEKEFASKTIKIAEGCHFGGADIASLCAAPDDRAGVKSEPGYRVMRFRLNFDNNCQYDHQNNNQGDWNKVMRIFSTQCDAWRFGGPQYYLSLGWRWRRTQDEVLASRKNTMELGFYSHIDHRDDPARSCYSAGQEGREFVSLGKYISIDEDVYAELIFYTRGYFVRAGNRGIAIRRDFKLEADPMLSCGNEKTQVRRGAFFGGQETAPHDMEIDLSTTYVDYPATWWSHTTYKGYGRSEFYDGETQTIYASDRVELSIPGIRNSQEVLPQYTTIQSGADITAVAGNQVRLLPGFYAEEGSRFHAYIGAAVNTEEEFEYTCPSTNKMAASDSSYYADEDSIIADLTGKQKENNKTEDAYTNSLTHHPNPLSNTTTITYTLAKASQVTLALTDIVGRQIAALEQIAPKSAGIHTIEYNASQLPAGIYFYTIQATSANGAPYIKTNKMVKIE